VEAEVATLLSRYADETTYHGRQRLVRHGSQREIMTGVGPVRVRCPRVRDRVGEGSQRIRFSSVILPPYAERSMPHACRCKTSEIGECVWAAAELSRSRIKCSVQAA
jgi:hypothetical protein